MRKRMIILAMALFVIRAGAQEGDKPGEKQNPLPTNWVIPPAPVRSPDEELKTLHLADDFLSIELFASEPMIQDPVALDFDAAGRAWVVEMRGYMADIEAHGEKKPVGRITILTDTDGDGRADKATVFLDHLVLPRAIKVCWGGALIATDNQLWFARDTNGDDVADVKEVVDPDYVRSGNPEHQPNGLLLAMDNWIYSTYADQRYRRVNGVWLREKTEFRGQWGISQDDLGRLYYNVNFSQLHGDPFPPNYSFRNPNYTPVHGINLQISTNQSIFTLRPNTGVNRAYRPGVLDARGHLKEFTSACSPMVERGGLFGDDTAQRATATLDSELNVLVCEPAANIIKRNIVRDDGLIQTSRFAYPDREFLASTDERFRPVNIYDAPDGSVFIVDMYRGICQHHDFMTTHLRREVLSRGLDKGIHLGRIWRVRNRAKPLRTVSGLERAPLGELLEALHDPSGWVRDTAQRLIIERGDGSVVPELLQIAGNENSVASLHAIGCLEGLLARCSNHHGLAGSITYAVSPDVWSKQLELINSDRPWVAVHAMRLAELLSGNDPARQTALIGSLRRRFDASHAQPPNLHWQLQAALTLGNFDQPETVAPLAGLLADRAADPVIRDAVLSARPGHEAGILQDLLAGPGFANFGDGRDIAIQQISSVLVRRGRRAEISELDALTARQTGAVNWRQLPLLNGFSENAGSLRNKPLRLDREPRTLTALAGDTNAMVRASLEAIRRGVEWPGHSLPRQVAPPLRKLSPAAALHVELGRTVFRNTCAACHGVAGAGLPNLGPPLVDSDWLKGPAQRVALIVLYGLEGPITVNGRAYAPPEILPNMPAVGTLSDAEIAAAASFVRREFGRQNGLLAPDAVTYLRGEHGQRDAPWMPEELLKLALPDLTPKPEKSAESHVDP